MTTFYDWGREDDWWYDVDTSTAVLRLPPPPPCPPGRERLYCTDIKPGDVIEVFDRAHPNGDRQIVWSEVYWEPWPLSDGGAWWVDVLRFTPLTRYDPKPNHGHLGWPTFRIDRVSVSDRGMVEGRRDDHYVLRPL